MLFSYNEIKKHLNISLESLVDSLVKLGHEVETCEESFNSKLIVGKVLEISSHPNADKLNVCQVDIGNNVIVQIVCGAPNVKKDLQVIVAMVGCKLDDFKIKKSKIRDVESNGMLCSLSEIGIEEKYLNSDEIEGIHLFDQVFENGSNALEALNMNDTIIDVSLTANRGDCLSYNGIIRDLKAVHLKDFIKLSNSEFEIENSFDSQIKLSIDPSTTSFNSMSIKIDKNKQSTRDIKSFLIKHQIKPQNVVVDAANYVMLQTGICIHTYDEDKISNKLNPFVLEVDEKFEALDGNEYNLKKGTLVIKDEKNITAVAGIIGSEKTKITDVTTNILVEIAAFDKDLVRYSLKNFNFKTDAATRSEKGIDHKAIENAFYMLCQILNSQMSNISFSKINTLQNKVEIQKLKLYFDQVEIVLGIKISQDTIIKILQDLEFAVIVENDFLNVEVGSHRHDIEGENDLIEEIIRVYGLDKIELYDIIPTFNNTKKVIVNSKAIIERELENVLLNTGSNQVVSYSLVSQNELEMFQFKNEKFIKLMMCLSKNHEFYRLSIIPSLIKIHLYNKSRQSLSSNIFEIANTYQFLNEEVVENLKVSGLVSGIKKSGFYNNVEHYDFFDCKNKVESIAQYFGVKFDYRKNVDISDTNPYACASIYCEGTEIGFIAQLHPEIDEDVYVFELDLNYLIKSGNKITKFKQIHQLADLKRDLTIHTNKDVDASEIENVFSKIKFLKKFELNNIYNQVDEIKSLTYSVYFNSHDINLTNEIVDLSIQKIVDNIRACGYEFKE